MPGARARCTGGTDIFTASCPDDWRGPVDELFSMYQSFNFGDEIIEPDLTARKQRF